MNKKLIIAGVSVVVLGLGAVGATSVGKVNDTATTVEPNPSVSPDATVAPVSTPTPDAAVTNEPEAAAAKPSSTPRPAPIKHVDQTGPNQTTTWYENPDPSWQAHGGTTTTEPSTGPTPPPMVQQ